AVNSRPPATAKLRLSKVPTRKYSANRKDFNSGNRTTDLAARISPTVPGDCKTSAVITRNRSSQPIYMPAFSSCSGPSPSLKPVSRGRITYRMNRSEEHTSELQSLAYLVCRILLEKK